jgi:hypothetical protein
MKTNTNKNQIKAQSRPEQLSTSTGNRCWRWGDWQDHSIAVERPRDHCTTPPGRAKYSLKHPQPTTLAKSPVYSRRLTMG